MLKHLFRSCIWCWTLLFWFLLFLRKSYRSLGRKLQCWGFKLTKSLSGLSWVTLRMALVLSLVSENIRWRHPWFHNWHCVYHALECMHLCASQAPLCTKCCHAQLLSPSPTVPALLSSNFPMNLEADSWWSLVQKWKGGVNTPKTHVLPNIIGGFYEYSFWIKLTFRLVNF